MEWKLTTLIENHEDTEEKYVCEHGFSILIENWIPNHRFGY